MTASFEPNCLYSSSSTDICMQVACDSPHILCIHPVQGYSFFSEEEQKLKELQLDFIEKVAVVEALKLELRQTTNSELGVQRLRQVTWHVQG